MVWPWGTWPRLQLKFIRLLGGGWGDIVSLRKQNYGSTHCEIGVAKCKIIKEKMLFPFTPLEKVPHIVLIFLF